jgi:hypothetical protein
MTQRRTALELYNIQPEDIRKSRAWFDDQIKFLSTKKVTPNRLINETGPTLTKTLTPGGLYFFYYNAKYKDTLPYWDMFPLVIPYATFDGGFRGLNMHYLEYKPRMELFMQLLKITGNKHLTPQSKIQYTWEMVVAASKMRGAKACIKNYLISQVASPFCPVEPENWHTAMMMPVQRFTGASKEYVWQQSRKIR